MRFVARKDTQFRMVGQGISLEWEEDISAKRAHLGKSRRTRLRRISRIREEPIRGIRSFVRFVMENANIPSGKIDIPPKKFDVRVSGQFERIEDIRETIVGVRNGKPIYLKDVAEVRRALKEPTYIARFNGRRTIFLTVTQKEGTNVLKLGARAETVLERVRDTLPRDLDVNVVFHQPD